MSWLGEERCVRWRAAKERPMVPVPMRVILRSEAVGVVMVEVFTSDMGWDQVWWIRWTGI